MGKRKRIAAEARKEANKMVSSAKLNAVPTSPRKMRLVADMIRGQEAFKALGILKFSNKEAASRMEKLLKSAIANWEAKNEKRADEVTLYISEVKVDSATMLKRLRPAPQGRGNRIRKRSNHITIVVDTRNNTKN